MMRNCCGWHRRCEGYLVIQPGMRWRRCWVYCLMDMVMVEIMTVIAVLVVFVIMIVMLMLMLMLMMMGIWIVRWGSWRKLE